MKTKEIRELSPEEAGKQLRDLRERLVLLRVPEFWRMFIQGSAIVGAATADVIIGAQIRKSLQSRRRGTI